MMMPNSRMTLVSVVVAGVVQTSSSLTRRMTWTGRQQAWRRLRTEKRFERLDEAAFRSMAT